MMKTEKFLSLEDMKVLIEKVYAAQQAGSKVVLISNNSGTTVYTTRKGINGGKNVERVFSMHKGLETSRGTYEECIEYLEQLV